LAGVILCLCGLGVLMTSDYVYSNNGSASAGQPLLGDALCLVSSLLYATSNVCQEVMVKSHDRVLLSHSCQTQISLLCSSCICYKGGIPWDAGLFRNVD
jgi:drug/metabolite transporter (DMT)-like permease